MQNLTPNDLQRRLDDTRLQLIDVRQRGEWDIAHLPQATLIPLDQLPARVGELDASRPVICVCHHGVRSEAAGRWLESQGFDNVSHLLGGIDAWSCEIDPNLPRY